MSRAKLIGACVGGLALLALAGRKQIARVALSLADLTKSGTAAKHGLSNQPKSDLHKRRLEALKTYGGEVLALAQEFDKRAHLSSAYRSPEVNAHPDVDGSPTSDHPQALAVDISVGPGIPYDYEPMARHIFANRDRLSLWPQQLIAENNPPHMHAGFPDETERVRGYTFTLSRETQARGARKKGEGRKLTELARAEVKPRVA